MPRLPFAGPLGQTKIYLYAKDVDMRKSFNGLHAIIQSEFQRDVRLGDPAGVLGLRLGAQESVLQRRSVSVSQSPTRSDQADALGR